MDYKLYNFNIKLLQNKTREFNNDNINKNSKKQLIKALKIKYNIFFSISKIPYKQFLSSFFGCILDKESEPFYIRVKDSYTQKISFKIFDKNSSFYNYISLKPWDSLNIIKCEEKHKTFEANFRISKTQFMESLIILFPKFIKRFPNTLLELNNRLNKNKKKDMSAGHLYRYLVYCGDKLAKDDFNKNKLITDNYLLNRRKIDNFLNLFSKEQFINLLN